MNDRARAVRGHSGRAAPLNPTPPYPAARWSYTVPRDDITHTTSDAASAALDDMEAELHTLRGIADLVAHIEGSPNEIDDRDIATISQLIHERHDRLYALWSRAIGRPETEAPAAPADDPAGAP